MKKISKQKMTFPKLIKLNTKHYDYKFLALNKKQYENVGLEILKIYKDCFFLIKDNSLGKETLEQYLNKQIKKYCEEHNLASLKELSTSKFKNLKVELKHYSTPKTAFEIIELFTNEYRNIQDFNNAIDLSLNTLKEKDGRKAWKCIHFFKNHEYQEVLIESFDNYRV